jgi:hypothetical protein
LESARRAPSPFPRVIKVVERQHKLGLGGAAVVTMYRKADVG